MLKIAVGSALLVAATHSLALSLGGAQGNVIIGRPLDVLVRGSIDAAESVSGLCLEAQVNYGDSRVPLSSISLAIQKVGLDGTGLLRVKSSLPVNEPVVSVLLKAGCDNAFSRTYTLLADFEPMPVPAAQVLAPNVASARSEVSGPLAVAKTAPAAPKAAGSAPARPALTQSPIRLAKPQPRPLDVPQPLAKRRPVAVVSVDALPSSDPAKTSTPLVQAPPPPAAPRLKLDPIDLSVSKGPANQPAPEKQPSAEVAATADGIPAASDEAQEKVRALEQELKGMREEQAKARQALEAVNAQLAQVQASGSVPVWAYGLGGALFLAVGGWWFLRQRSKSVVPPVNVNDTSSPWWVTPSRATAAASEPSPVVAGLAMAADGPTEAQASVMSAPEDWLHGVDLKEGSAASVLSAAGEVCSVEDLLDLVQQVDFFESLGQDADASDTLASFVRKHAQTGGEVPYLLWMRHCMERGLHGQLLEVQQLYSQQFQRSAPPASSFDAGAPGLDQDSAYLLQLCKRWPGPEAREWLEQALFSLPGANSAGLSVRTLGAYEDLFLLHGILSYSSYLHSTDLAAAPIPDEPSAADVSAFFGVQVANSAADAPPQDAPETTALGWDTLSEMPSETLQPVKAPEPVVSAPVVASASANPHLLDFDLTDLAAKPAATPAAASAPAANPKAMPSLDFDFEDIKASLPTGKKLG